MKIKKEKLESCPFCGERFALHLYKTFLTDCYYIVCHACGARSPVNTWKDMVVAIWNRSSKLTHVEKKHNEHH